MRRYIGMALCVGLVTAALSLSGALPVGAQGPFKPLAALIVNDSDNPVPVVPPTPKLRASAGVFTGGPLALPTGVVFTDFVISSGDPDCKSASIGFFPNEGGAGNLNLDWAAGEPTMQLHLTTGVRSTVEEPLILSVQVNCSVSVFWSGYEG